MLNRNLSARGFKAVLSTIGLLALVSLPGCSLFNQSAEETRVPAVLKPVNSKVSVQKLWSANVGGAAEGLGFGLRPAAGNGVIFLAGFNGVVTALNAESGKNVWSTSTGAPISSGAGTGAGRVVVGSNNGVVIALDAENGNELWRSNVSGEILAAPAVSAEHVAVRSANGTITVLNSNNGSELWKEEQEVPRLSLRGYSSPLVVSGVVLVGSDSGKITSYRALDGASVWGRLLGLPRGSTELERLIDIDGQMVLNDVHLYAAGYNSRVAKLDARNGNIIWNKEISSNSGVGLGYQSIFVSDADGFVHSLDQDTGVEKWKNQDYKYRDLTVPAAAGRALAVGDLEGFVHFLSPQDGTTIARTRASKSAIRVAPLAIADVVYIQADDGSVVAYRVSE